MYIFIELDTFEMLDGHRHDALSSQFRNLTEVET